MTKKEKLAHLTKLIQESKEKLNEAARFAIDNNIDYELNLYGIGFYPEELTVYGETKKEIAEENKRYKHIFGAKAGDAVWSNSSAFC